MNLQAILSRVAAQIGVDALDEEERALAVDYVNEGMEDLMRIFRPYIELTVAATASGIIGREQMGESAGRVMRVCRRGVAVPFDEREDGQLVVTAQEGTPLTVRCRYLPPQMREDADTPGLPQRARGALADYASWRLMQTGGRARQQRGEAYYARFLQHRAVLVPQSLAYRDEIIHKYG